MNLTLHHLLSFTKSNWILLLMVTIVSLLIVGIYSLGQMSYLSVMVPFFIYYTQVQVLQKQQSLKYKLSLPESRQVVFFFISLEFLILAIPQIITLQVFYHTLPNHAFYNPDRATFLLYTILGFFTYSIYLTGQWIDSTRREITIKKWEVFISNIYIIASSLIKLTFTISLFRFAYYILDKNDLVHFYSRPIVTTIFLLLCYFLHSQNIKLYLKEELSSFMWKRQGFTLGVIFIFCMISIPYYYYYKIKKVGVETPLFEAILEKDYLKAKDLLSKVEDRDLERLEDHGWNLQNISIISGQTKFLKYLLDRGLNLNQMVVKSPMDPLHHQIGPFQLALLSGSQRMVEFLTYHLKSWENEKNIETGDYPLHMAVRMCRLDFIDTIVKELKEPLKLNRNGKTPLMLAIDTNCLIAINSLLPLEIDLKIADIEGISIEDRINKGGENLKYLFRKRLNPIISTDLQDN